MGYANRKAMLDELGQARGSSVLVYVTGDRPGMETQVHPEQLDMFVDHLDRIGPREKISLYLYTRGGHTMAAWSIVNLIRQFCSEFEVIIPAKAHSAGTLIALGANRLVMTKQATLGPIDPSINTPLNPGIPGAPNNARFAVSVEAINGFIELAKEIGVDSSADRAQVLASLSQQVHPLVLGQVYRTRSQIRMLGRRLLERHLQDQKAIDSILAFLCSESGSHDYTIYRQEARKLGLTVDTPTDDLYALIKGIYDNVAAELMLTTPFDPAVLVPKPSATASYSSKGSLLESLAGGSHSFLWEGTVEKATVQGPMGPQPAVRDTRTFQGWRHDKP